MSHGALVDEFFPRIVIDPDCPEGQVVLMHPRRAIEYVYPDGRIVRQVEPFIEWLSRVVVLVNVEP